MAALAGLFVLGDLVGLLATRNPNTLFLISTMGLLLAGERLGRCLSIRRWQRRRRQELLGLRGTWPFQGETYRWRPLVANGAGSHPPEPHSEGGVASR